ncbi:MAG: hypothetical protein KDA60_06955 [Planctomycetales bacterium]|nr:hypothetical protein [Planctomycetales bacterium]
MRVSPRNRRLANDFAAMQKLADESSILRFKSYGNPPEAYDVFFAGNGLRRMDLKVGIVAKHEVSVRLGMTYPCVMPELRWKTDIFHPNISSAGAVCLGGYQVHWVPSLDLAELCEMLWDMIRYDNFDVTSPYNRDAANWARLQREFKFPVDQRSLRDRVTRSVRKQPEIIDAEVIEIIDAVMVDEGNAANDDILFID